MFIRSCMYLPANDMILFFTVSEQISIVYQSHIFLIHSAADGYLGWFHKLALVTSVAVRMDVQGL